MNASDLARLDIAKRAFRATEPRAAEVQAGVRRTRLALRRPKERRRWFSKGLVMVVLAVGGLAYAKPQPLGELVSSVLGPSSVPRKASSGKGAGRLEPTQPDSSDNRATKAGMRRSEEMSSAPGAAGQVEAAGERPHADDAQSASSTPVARGQSSLLQRAARGPRPNAAAAQAETGAPAPAPVNDTSVDQPNRGSSGGGRDATQGPLSPAKTTSSMSDWGRVGQALAQGDESKALLVLAELAESADQRTRDKADLGRAQLFMSHGNREHACAIARSLLQRRVDSSIARQTQVVLKNCQR